MLGAYPRPLHGARLSLGKWDCKQRYTKQVEALFINCPVYMWLESGTAFRCPENLHSLAREGEAHTDQKRFLQVFKEPQLPRRDDDLSLFCLCRRPLACLCHRCLGLVHDLSLQGLPERDVT